MLTRKMLIMWIYQLLLFSCAFYHKVYATDEVNCKTCPKGYGVVFPCNITANTICEACPPGTYSDVESVFEECRPCSRCGKGLYEMHPCTGTSDTFCELCSWQEAVPNDDYNIKCKDANLDAKNQNLKDKSGKSDEEPDVVAWLGGEGLPLAESLKGHDPAVVSGQEGDTGPSKLPEQPVDKPAEPDAGKSDILEPNPQQDVGANNNGDGELIMNPQGPKVGGMGIKVKTRDPTAPTTVLPTTPYTGPKAGGMGLVVKTHDPALTTRSTPEPYTGPKVAQVAVKQRTYDPKKTTDVPTIPNTGPKAGGMVVVQKTHNPMSTTQVPTVRYTGARIVGMGMVRKTHDPKKTTGPPTTVYTGPKVAAMGIKKRTYDPSKTTVTTKEPYTGPRIRKMGLLVKTYDPKKTTVITPEPYTGPRIAQGIGLRVKTYDPKKTTQSTLEPYTGPKVGEIGLVVKKRTTTTTTTTTSAPAITSTEPTEKPDQVEVDASGNGELEAKPIPAEGEATETADSILSSRIGHVLGGGPPDAKVAQQKDLTPNDKNAKEPKGMGVSVFSITMVALSVGVVFFVIGFAVDRWRHRTKHPTDQYELAAETPSMPAQEMVYRTPIYTEKNGVAPATIQEETELTPTTPTPITSMGDTQSKSQSPINIDPEDADPDVSLGNNPLLYKYVPGNSKSITNTGSTIRLDVDGQGSQLSGGPFSSTYEFHHIDFKWGSTNEKGSEHTVNGVPAAAEVQLVHWNCKDYKSYEAAEKGEDGLAVLSVLFKVGRSEHTGVKKLTDCLPSIQFKGESRELPGNEFDPASLLPDTTSLYWTYLGSTTTQPYHESVTWVIFKDTLEVTTEQIDEFRKLRPYHKDEERLLKAPDNDFLADNFRSVQPLGDRTVRASFV